MVYKKTNIICQIETETVIQLEKKNSQNRVSLYRVMSVHVSDEYMGVLEEIRP